MGYKIGMDLNALRYFLVIAEEQHFTRAAERLQMAQPNLTWIMRKLEEELGFVLTSSLVVVLPAHPLLETILMRCKGENEAS
jgi:regulatory helix-turn-helix LysR family protein